MTGGQAPGTNLKSYFGVMVGQSQNNQKYGISEYGSGNVENKTTTTVGGIYGLVVNRPESSRAWYGQWSLLHGGVNFRNVVPGEIAGAGLTQNYNGTVTMLTLENGVSFRQKKWLAAGTATSALFHSRSSGRFSGQSGRECIVEKREFPVGAPGSGSEANRGKDAGPNVLLLGESQLQSGVFSPE